MALVIAGERSGVGKTTITLALLSYLQKQGVAVQSFKVGPDYIDPMFHRAATGRACCNLDPVLTSETYVQQCFATHSQTADYALVEGVMGLFDGAAEEVQAAKQSKLPQPDSPIAPTSAWGSTAHVAKLLQCPIALVVDCSRLSHSVAALVQGYRCFDPQLQVVGVILNRVGSDRHLDLLRSALDKIGMPVLGVVRRQAAIAIPDRHLGLVPTDELPQLTALFTELAELAATSFDWDALLPLLAVPPKAATQAERDQLELPLFPELPTPTHVRVAIARDAAFNFYYPDNLDLLTLLGAELVFWSPLTDREMPDVDGLYLGGGFPEVFAEQLATNKNVRTQVKQAILAGLPTYAECGGLIYLCESLTTFEGDSFPMVGVLPTQVVMGQKLTLGYRQAIATTNTSLITQNQTLWGHEFHHSHLTQPPQAPIFRFTHPPSLTEGWKLLNLHASYLHLHWGATPEIPHRFLAQCQQFQATRS